MNEIEAIFVRNGITRELAFDMRANGARKGIQGAGVVAFYAVEQVGDTSFGAIVRAI